MRRQRYWAAKIASGSALVLIAACGSPQSDSNSTDGVGSDAPVQNWFDEVRSGPQDQSDTMQQANSILRVLPNTYICFFDGIPPALWQLATSSTIPNFTVRLSRAFQPAIEASGQSLTIGGSSRFITLPQQIPDTLLEYYASRCRLGGENIVVTVDGAKLGPAGYRLRWQARQAGRRFEGAVERSDPREALSRPPFARYNIYDQAFSEEMRRFSDEIAMLVRVEE